MGDYRVIVTGSREYRGNDVLREISLLAMEHGENLVIVHGDARSGADALARLAAKALGVREEPHPADWNGYGKAAGFIRNAEMVSLGADCCLAFYQQGAGNKGTDHCARLAEQARIPVRRITNG